MIFSLLFYPTIAIQIMFLQFSLGYTLLLLNSILSFLQPDIRDLKQVDKFPLFDYTFLIQINTIV